MINIEVKENTLIICPNSYKEKFLESFNSDKKIVDVNFMTLEEYKKNILFDYDIDTIKCVVDKLQTSVLNAREIIENLYYVDVSKKYDIEKLDKLVEIKKTLIAKNLLLFNKLFESYVLNKNVVVVGYGALDSYHKNLIKGKTVAYIEEELRDKKYKLYEFNDIEKEVEHVYNSISDLIDKGVDINNIYIVNSDREYNSYFKRYNTYYNFRIVYDTSESIYGTSLANSFINNLNKKTRQELYEELKDKDSDLAHSLINILNKYAKYNLKEVKEFVVNDIKNSKINKDNYTDVVKCVSINNGFSGDDYVFVVGFNENTPTMIKDDQYITDKIRNLLGMSLIEESNELLKYNYKAVLSNIDNLYISYCESSPFSTYNKQILFDDEDVEYLVSKDSYEYSDKLNRVKYGYMLDRLSKYGYISEDMDDLYKTYGDDNYLKYNNKFKELNRKQIAEINNVTLSYSSMNSYYECAFKYYLDKVLKISDYSSTYYAGIGSLCHEVLKDLYEEGNFDFEKSWNTNLDKLSAREKEPLFNDEMSLFFASKIKEELKKDIEIIKRQKDESTFDKEKCENEFLFNVTDDITFKGFIDKVMYKIIDDEIYVSVIDYKTGNSIKIEEDLMEYGLSLQLPSYLYLMKNDELFKNAKYAGLYLQHIINSNIKYTADKTRDEIKRESMKLEGISSSVPERMQAFDTSLLTNNRSENIKSLALKKDGDFTSNSRVKSDQEISELIELTERKVKEAGKKILNGEFKINPKVIEKENKSCKYCPYLDICYKRVGDLEYIKIKEDDGSN